MREAENANTSTNNVTIEDDCVIPETQEVLSQESPESFDESCIIVEQNKSHLLPHLKMWSQSDVSILSISSCEDREVTQINLNAPNANMVGGDAVDAVHSDVKAEVDETTQANGKCSLLPFNLEKLEMN